jgi:hypothetical protein
MAKIADTDLLFFYLNMLSIQMGDDIDQSRMILLFEVLGTRGTLDSYLQNSDPVLARSDQFCALSPQT